MSETLVMSRPCAGAGLGVRTTARHGSEGQLRELHLCPRFFFAQADITGYGSGKEFFYSVKCVTCQPCRTRFALLGIR